MKYLSFLSVVVFSIFAITSSASAIYYQPYGQYVSNSYDYSGWYRPVQYTQVTCPMNSHHDSYGSCTCNPGYALHDGWCTTVEYACQQQIGLMSYWSSTTNRCECQAGYQYDGVSCTEVPRRTNYYFYNSPLFIDYANQIYVQ